ncbi:MAG TPA: NTP transferase domain-containing protein [Bacteroidales bacterium]|nr:NTP transferase domain-containing protein [Bacteroidales bacterium]
MKFAIIAAGEGSRLRKEGLYIPKPMIEIGGMTLIDRLIDRAKRYEFSTACIIVNDIYPELANWFRDKDYGIFIQLIVKSTPGSMHSFYELSQFLRDDDFILTTVDPIYTDESFRYFLEFIDTHPHADGIMAATNYVDDEKPLWIICNNRMQIVEFSDTQKESSLVSAGFYYFKPLVINFLEKAMQQGMFRMRDIQRFLLKQGCSLIACNVGKVIDIDHTSDILQAELMLKSKNS